MSGIHDEVDALLAGTACTTVTRDRIRCSGPDSVRFLHSLLSQSIEDLAVGSARWSFLLEPQGRVVGLLRVERVADDELVLDAEPGHGEAIRSTLARYLIRTRCDIAAVEPTEVLMRPAPGGVPEVVVDPALRVVSAGAWAIARVVAGIPVHGRDFGDGSIANTTGLVPVATARKGCYVGQEVVERIDSRGGNVPERLVLLHGAPEGAALHDAGGAVVGRVTSAVEHGSVVHGIGSLRRSAAVGSPLVWVLDGSSGPAVAVGEVGRA